MNNRPIRHVASLAAISAVALIAVGCGSSSSSSSSSTTATTSTSAGASQITVDMTEMKITPTPTSAAAGKVTFDVSNVGKITHEMVLIKTDKPAGKLGTGTTVSEAGAVGETGDVAAGASKTVTFDLKPGHYALICNIPGHYSAGMYSDFNVS